MYARNGRKTLSQIPAKAGKLSTSDKIAIIGLVFSFLALIVSVFFAYRTYVISEETLDLQKKSDTEGQKIIGLNDLIKKTDIVVSDLNEQLPVLRGVLAADSSLLFVNGEIQSIANTNHTFDNRANKNRFYVALYGIANLIQFKEDAAKWNPDERNNYFAGLKDIFEKQSANPYILQNDSLYYYWKNANNSLNLFTNGTVYDSTFSDEFYGRVRTRLDEIDSSKSYVDRTFGYCWNEVNKAFLYGVKVYKNDRK